MSRMVAERFQYQEEIAAWERANQQELREMQRKVHRESFVSMFRGVPCQLAAGAAHDLDCSNGDLLALLARLCGVDTQNYHPGVPW